MVLPSPDVGSRRVSTDSELPSGISALAAAFMLAIETIRRVRLANCLRFPDRLLASSGKE